LILVTPTDRATGRRHVKELTGSLFKELINMAIKIISFGQLSEITGKDFQAEVEDTDQLTTLLRDQYKMPGDIKYLIAVNKKVINQNTY
jgi:hypothetical protein